jgi:hypothetical protein
MPDGTLQECEFENVSVTHITGGIGDGKRAVAPEA